MTELERTDKWARRLAKIADEMRDPAPDGADPVKWEGCRISLLRFSRDLVELAEAGKATTG